MGAEPCDDPLDRVDEARQALLLMDLGTAQAALASAEAAFDCSGVADRDTLGTFWLVEGALSWFGGDRDAATDSLQAAHRVAPDIWYVDFGSELLGFYEEVAAASQGTGAVDVKDLAPGYRTWVDGRSAMLPQDVPAGLHLVQIGTVHDVRFSKVVFVVADRTSSVDPELPPLVSVPTDVYAPPAATTRAPVSLELWVGAGVGTWLGQARSAELDGELRQEAGWKWVVPVDAGVTVRSDVWWGRAFGDVAPVIGSPLLYETRDGRVGGAVVGRGGGAAAGATVGGTDLGLRVAATVPSRLSVQALGGSRVGSLPLVIEGRLGTNVLTDGRLEPAIGLTVGVCPVLVDPSAR